MTGPLNNNQVEPRHADNVDRASLQAIVPFVIDPNDPTRVIPLTLAHLLATVAETGGASEATLQALLTELSHKLEPSDITGLFRTSDFTARIPTNGRKASAGSLPTVLSTEQEAIIQSVADRLAKGAANIAQSLAVNIATDQVVPVTGRANRAEAVFNRPANTTAYTARDAVTNSEASNTPNLVFDLARANGGSGIITKVRLVTNHATNANGVIFRLWLYTVNTAAVAGDNAPYTVLWANRAVRVGYIDLPGLTTEGGVSDSAMTLQQTSLSFNCAAADTKLYGILQTLGGFTPASGQSFYVELTAELN